MYSFVLFSLIFILYVLHKIVFPTQEKDIDFIEEINKMQNEEYSDEEDTCDEEDTSNEEDADNEEDTCDEEDNDYDKIDKVDEDNDKINDDKVPEQNEVEICDDTQNKQMDNSSYIANDEGEYRKISLEVKKNI